MRKFLLSAALLATCLLATNASAEIGLGADVVSRYIFRGTDFGNAVTVQPGISYSTGSVEIGAWSSWAITDGGANENDIYVSFSAGPVGITVTDYYFPGLTADDQFFSFSDGDGVHILEASASLSLENMPISLLAAFNFSGDADDSFWVEATYDLGEIDETAVSITAGAGNGLYTTDTDPNLVALGVNVSKGDYFASYILNPDKESTFLVFGRSF